MSNHHLQLAVLRLNDMCVNVQEGMDDYLRTASIEKMPGVESIFSWLRKRDVRICLLSDFDRARTAILLERLGWTVDEDGTVQEVITDQGKQANPITLAQEHAGLTDARASFSVMDTPRLLRQAHEARVHFNLAICNGRSTYNQLAVAPHHGMLDKLVQLPNFLLEHLPDPQQVAGPQVQRRLRIPRLRLPSSLF